ncbi:MAG: DUF4369 domain-containing protein [Mediterranea sp.]|jgi:hypothetical protein|nr:DUF4369 domain-containing protein [Mediterranea sp.]
MNVYKLLVFIFLLASLASCARGYKIEGATSAVNNSDGKTVYLQAMGDSGWVKIDSAEVVHGLFAMDGTLDSTRLVTLYLGDQYVMPIVLENGKIEVVINYTESKAKGTPLNDALFGFIAKRSELEDNLENLDRKEAQLVMDGGDVDEVHERITLENDSLIREMDGYVKKFIADNYDNVLGPGVFMMLCSSLRYPIITPQIDDIIKDAPYSFKSNRLVREFLSTARENMKLMEEHERLEQNISKNQK